MVFGVLSFVANSRTFSLSQKETLYPLAGTLHFPLFLAPDNHYSVDMSSLDISYTIYTINILFML
jgi:hypothetical protein